jgi:hypothetical protein
VATAGGIVDPQPRDGGLSPLGHFCIMPLKFGWVSMRHVAIVMEMSPKPPYCQAGSGRMIDSSRRSNRRLGLQFKLSGP